MLLHTFETYRGAFNLHGAHKKCASPHVERNENGGQLGQLLLRLGRLNCGDQAQDDELANENWKLFKKKQSTV